MKFKLRDYQAMAVDHAIAWFGKAQPGDRIPYAAPTGSGKSVIELAVQEALGDDCWILTPWLGVIAGLIDKLGLGVPDSDVALAELAWSRRITTPLRLRTQLMRGEAREPGQLILDEAHHDLAQSWQDIHALCGYAPAAGYTASPYRGTPKATAAYREQWGEPVWILSYPQAVERGVISIPTAETWALVDDDLIEHNAGEFVASRVDSAVKSRLGQICERSARYYQDGRWDRPTMFAWPSRDLAHQAKEELRRLGAEAFVADGDTPWAHRTKIFDLVLNRHAALCQVMVVSEGIDLPIRRLIDCRPCLSPVKWIQTFGRTTRLVAQGEAPPHYVCTNRNLLRHGYLLDGCLPPAVFKEAQQVFGGPSKRSAARALGLEAIGRFKCANLPLADGTLAAAYSVSAVEGFNRVDYYVIVHPAREEPIWASARHTRKADGTYAYGEWAKCEAPRDLQGFASKPPSTLSDKQRAWWKRSARGFGLDPDAEVDRHVFPALPVLVNLRRQGVRL